MAAKLLGLVGSLRNVVRGDLGETLVNDLRRIDDKDTLLEYLKINSQLPAESYFEPIAPVPSSLLGIYKGLKKRKVEKGMSNSEVALAAALWAAQKMGADVEYLSLRDYFSPTEAKKNVNRLMSKIEEADGLLLSGPVYFGDRGSLIHMLIRTLRAEKNCEEMMRGKFYGGIAVGAKRNGGQETTLIYQVLDMSLLGCLAVGNDSDTTAQYGGTCHAGNVGVMHKDLYGIDTAMGTGRRLASLINMKQKKAKLKDKVKVLFLILQDAGGLAVKQVEALCKQFGGTMSPTVIDVTKLKIVRCLACDVCPSKLDVDEVYRCEIGGADDFEGIHLALLDHDAIVPVAVSLNDVSKIKTNYQIFLERTRYLRRGDYVFSNVMVSPFVLQEIGCMEHLYIRMITSLIRQHTVMSKPIVGHLVENKILNARSVEADFKTFLVQAKSLAESRLKSALDGIAATQYRPVGYVLDTEKDKEHEILTKREQIVRKREQRITREARRRLAPSSLKSHE
jgi:multimeric flavodoxin WrbA